jgi:cell division transport system permease protein
MKDQASNQPAAFFNMQFLTSTISTTLVLILLGLVLFFVLAADNLSVYVRENLSFSILINDDMREADILKLQQQLDGQPFVKSSVYISKQQALEEQTEAMGADPEEFLGYNPFKASLEIKLHSEYANSDSIAVIEQYIKKNSNIDEVLYRKELIDAVNDNIRTISVILIGLALVLTVISFSLINNTIRLAIYAQRFIIHTMKLVGAGWWFIRKPFLLRNLWSGVAAGVLANFLLVGMIYALIHVEPDLIGVITLSVIIKMAVWVFVFGALITWVCAFIAINRFLRLRGNALYYM